MQEHCQIFINNIAATTASMCFRPKKNCVKLYRCAANKEDEDNVWCLYAHNVLMGVGITNYSFKKKDKALVLIAPFE